MKSSPSPTLETSLRLDAIVSNLGIGTHWRGPESEKEVILACLDKVSGLVDGLEPHGEALSARVARHFQVHFEEVRTDDDITALEELYLRGKKEIGFARLRQEIHTPTVDALLFQRLNATMLDPDRWVAVLNMTVTEDRAYWNRFHELSHRLAEPPQLLLPFRRQLLDDQDPVEKLIDAIAGNIAFHPRLFGQHLSGALQHSLTFDVINQVRNAYAPSASLLSVTNAIVQRWNRPAVAFVAAMKTKKGSPRGKKELRIVPQGRNRLAVDSGLFLFENMRVPISSCAYETFLTGLPISATENSGIWSTSSGQHLPEFSVTVSALALNERIYGVMTVN